VSKGIEQIWDFDGTWLLGYRKANEAMKREQRLFINGAGSYGNYPDDKNAFLLFIDRIEAIITEEQKNYFGRLDDSVKPQRINRLNV